jgi:hypothetical protein
MAVPNWTNIIGKSFSTTVTGQLSARGKILASGIGGVERTNADLLWLTNRNGWLRITSNVDIKAGAEGGPLAKTYGAGAGLAQKYILQGGVAFANAASNNGSVLRSGIGPDRAYGVGYKPNSPGDMGLKPMPGVTSFSISCDGPYGALKTANVKIKAYDLEQFNIIETLYCHLGYSIIVEFGHIPYINNDGVLQTQIRTLPVFSLDSKEAVANEISRLRTSTSGNYDALFGTVTNYSWVANQDGSYDIDLKIIGPGSIVESLTINYTTSNVDFLASPSQLPIYKEFLERNNPKQKEDSPPDPLAPPPAPIGDATAGGDKPLLQKVDEIIEAKAKQELPGVIASRNNSILHKHLFAIYEHALTSNQVQNKFWDNSWWEFWKPDDQDTPPSEAIQYSTDAAVASSIFKQNKSYDFLKVSGNSLGGSVFAQKGNNSWFLNHPNATDVPNISPNLISFLVAAYLTSPAQEQSTKDATNKDQLPQVYIPLGYFLAILQSSGMLYNSKKGDDKATKTRPVVYIDFNDKTNFCYAEPYSLSVDPSICLVDIGAKGSLMKDLFGGFTATNGEKVLPNTLGTITEDNKYVPEADLLSPIIKKNNLGFYNTGTSGYMMHIMMNIEYLVGKLDSLAGTDANKEVKVDRFLTEVLGDINNAMGGVNQFRVAFNDDSYCINLLDEQRIDDGKGQIQPAIIDVLGLNSIVYNYSLSSKISPKLSSMLVIAAQATAGKTKQAAVNASAVAKWNEFVKDRIAPTKVDSTDGDATGAKTGNETQNQSAAGSEGGADTPDNQLSRHLKGIYCTFRYNVEDIEAARNTLSEKFKARQANQADTEGSAMIPLEFSIKMDGISGILVNQAFVIPPERLPISYQTSGDPSSTKLGFIVRKVENAIENNQWVTSISGQSLVLPSAVRAPIKEIKVDTNPLAGLKTSVTTTPTVSQAPKSALDPTEQKKTNEKLASVSLDGKIVTPNTYTFIPKNAPKSVDVFIFYPGIIVDGKQGRDYMAPSIKQAVPDWFDKYVIVFPTLHTTDYASVRKEVNDLLAKRGLTQRLLNIGIFSGSGNGDASVLQAVKNAGKELRTFIIMDPSPSANLRAAIKARQKIGGTFQYLWYRPYWGAKASKIPDGYYGGKGANGKLYGNISLLVPLLKNAYETDIGHMNIPAAMLKYYKATIEQGLG